MSAFEIPALRASMERTALLLLAEGRTSRAVLADAAEMEREGFRPSAAYRRQIAAVMEPFERRRREVAS